MSYMDEMIDIDVVSIQPGKPGPDGQQAIGGVSQFTMKVRRRYVAATNVVDTPPTPEVKSIVYFNADSGMKPILSSEDADVIAERADVA